MNNNENKSLRFSQFYIDTYNETEVNAIRVKSENQKITDKICEQIKSKIREASKLGNHYLSMKMNIIKLLKVEFRIEHHNSMNVHYNPIIIEDYINRVRDSFINEGFAFDYIQLNDNLIQIDVRWERKSELQSDDEYPDLSRHP